MNLQQNNFEIRLVATAGEEVRIELPNMSAAAISWEDTEYDTDDADEEFLIPDEEGDESDDVDTDDEAQGKMAIRLNMTADAFKEYRALRDSDTDYTITATIVYNDANGVPLFHHEYDCYDGMYLVHESGSKQLTEELTLELVGDYHDCIQFAVFDEPEAVVQH
jgi:hypothetical protein